MKGPAVLQLCAAAAMCTLAAGVTVDECGERRADRRLCVDAAWRTATHGATVEGSLRLNEAALACLQEAGCVRRGAKAGNGRRTPRAAGGKADAAGGSGAAAPDKKRGGNKRKLTRCIKRELGFNPHKTIAECMKGKGYGKEKRAQAQRAKPDNGNSEKVKKAARAQWKGFPKVYRKSTKCEASEQAVQCIADATGLHVPTVKVDVCAAKARCQSVPDECGALLAGHWAARRRARCECAQAMGVTADRLTEIVDQCTAAGGGGKQNAAGNMFKLVQLLEQDCAAIQAKVKSSGGPKRDFCDSNGDTEVKSSNA